jgi:hypothetical protein
VLTRCKRCEETAFAPEHSRRSDRRKRRRDGENGHDPLLRNRRGDEQVSHRGVDRERVRERQGRIADCQQLKSDLSDLTGQPGEHGRVDHPDDAQRVVREQRGGRAGREHRRWRDEQHAQVAAPCEEQRSKTRIEDAPREQSEPTLDTLVDQLERRERDEAGRAEDVRRRDPLDALRDREATRNADREEDEAIGDAHRDHGRVARRRIDDEDRALRQGDQAAGGEQPRPAAADANCAGCSQDDDHERSPDFGNTGLERCDQGHGDRADEPDARNELGSPDEGRHDLDSRDPARDRERGEIGNQLVPSRGEQQRRVPSCDSDADRGHRRV